jgi:hypothetical protein
MKKYVIDAPARNKKVAATHPGKKTFFSSLVKPGTTKEPTKYRIRGSEMPIPPKKQIFIAIKMGE